MDVSKLTIEQLCHFLDEKGFSQQVVSNFKENNIDGDLFTEMTDEHFKEVAPLISDRIKLKKFQKPTKPMEKLVVTQPNSDYQNQQGSNSSEKQVPPTRICTQEPVEHPQQHQWHHTFTIPAGFSSNTEDAISTGILTSRVRIEIVQSLSASILVHTKNPTPEEFNTVCSKLIERYPTLRDEYGGSGYSSWKKKLRDRFKFLRSRKSSERDHAEEEEPPASKRVRNEEYEEHVLELQSEMAKRKKDRNIATIQCLTAETFSGRRQWILQESSVVHDILQKFPSLQLRKVFRSEFKRVIGLADDMSIHSLLESWDVWQQRIVAYSRLECTSRKNLKDYVTTFDSSDDNMKGILALQMLEVFLIAKAKKERVVYFAENCDDLGEVGRTVKQSAPILCICKTSEGITFHVIVEQEPQCELPSFPSALLHLIGSYYIYNIEYPRPLRCLFLFVEHHILGLNKTNMKEPPNVVLMATALRKL